MVENLLPRRASGICVHACPHGPVTLRRGPEATLRLGCRAARPAALGRRRAGSDAAPEAAGLRSGGWRLGSRVARRRFDVAVGRWVGLAWLTHRPTFALAKPLRRPLRDRPASATRADNVEEQRR